MAGRIISLWGRPWTWKSYLGLEAVRYVDGLEVVFDFDNNLDEVLPHYADVSSRIKVVPCALPAVLGVDEWAPKGYNAHVALKKFAQVFKKACEDPKVGTVMVDTFTLNYQVVREKRLEQVIEEAEAKGETRKTLSPFEHGPINLWLAGALKFAKDNGKTVILINHARPVYVDNEATGEYERDGWGKLQENAQLELQAVRLGEDVKLIVHKSTYHKSVPPSLYLPASWETVEAICNRKPLKQIAKSKPASSGE